MTPLDDARPDIRETLFALAQDMTKLDPGPLARLRRMTPGGPGEGTFWVLALRHGLRQDGVGMTFVRLLALLTPKGAADQRKLLHDGKRPLGKVLAGAGYPEMRLLRFLSLPFEARGDSLERMIRWLAAKGHEGVDTVDIALLLFSPDVRPARRLAKTYYDALRTSQKDDAA